MSIPSVPEPYVAFIDVDGRRIAIRHRSAAPGRPTVLFLPGYASDMAGQKALAVDQFCAGRSIGCLRLDYSGTGASAGDFAEGTLARWLDEVLAVIDQSMPKERLIVAGSSMGGWLALHAAMRRPDQVTALLGIAAAPDFTDWGYSSEDKATLARDGKLDRFNSHSSDPMVTHRAFWRSGETHRLLDAPIDLAVPIRLVHGVDDQEVPVEVPLKLVDQLGSRDVQLRLIKGGGHRLSEPHEIQAILAELGSLIEKVDLPPALTTSPAENIKDEQ